VLAAAVSGCGNGTAAPSVHRLGAQSGKVTISAADKPACAPLLTRLQLVTVAISNDSELITSSVNAQQLSHRIGTEAQQLTQSGELMSSTPAPAPLAATQRQLVAALGEFSTDLRSAEGAAQRGDYQTATDAMDDKPVIDKIVKTSTTIQDACSHGAGT
jgi:hypothetical protein